MRIVMKFGGTSVGTGESIRKVAKIVTDAAEEHEVIVVVSAMSGVTDELVRAAESAPDWTEEDVKNFVGKLRRRHGRAASEAISSDLILREVMGYIDSLLEELEKVLLGLSYVGEVTSRSTDLILSFGERMSAPIVAGALRDQGLEAEHLEGGEAGVITDDRFGEAEPILPACRRKAQKTLIPMIESGKIPVITGFIGRTIDGEVTTLGRGGSDYSAAIIGCISEADEVQIWTDVDGVMTANPNLVPDARTVPKLSYEEAMELASFGAEVLHPKTVIPVRPENIPIRVKNTFNPESEGTLITSESEPSEQVVKAVASSSDVGMVDIRGITMIGRPGVAGRVFSRLGEEGINVIMISQSASESNISIVVDRPEVHRAARIIEREFVGERVVERVTTYEDVAVVAVVGEGMRGTPGVASRVFRAVADAGVNVKTISQGASEVNISFVVAEEDEAAAVNAVHSEFELGEEA
ncbi:aspartate kinase [Methanopyrus sp. KOL6]|uniref:aspartate kinase n=1 Tax=Methanopyrus sp. KOL6 TaxID=1937004 RepID=UPI000B4B6D9B|nr:aspartate kinase [Methanopyrus sp. KOL6]